MVLTGVLLVLSVVMAAGICWRWRPPLWQGLANDHFDGTRFFNPGKPEPNGWLAAMRWKWTRKPAPWPAYSALPETDHPPARVSGNQLRVSFIGQATVLIQTQGLNILTDPLWSDRASPIAWMGPRRVHPPGIDFADLPSIDLVLISHSHYDHLDLPTLRRLYRRDHPLFLAPLGNDLLLRQRIPGICVQTGDWGDALVIKPQLTVHVEFTHHWSARTPFDRNRALWGSFVLETPGGRIYFVGDTGFGGGDHFRDLYQKHGSLRLAILPIGAYEPRWFMAYSHMCPGEGVRAWELLGRPWMLATHIRTFPLADEGYAQPLEDLNLAMTDYQVPVERIQPLMPGTCWWIKEEDPS